MSREAKATDSWSRRRTVRTRKMSLTPKKRRRKQTRTPRTGTRRATTWLTKRRTTWSATCATSASRTAESGPGLLP